MNMNEKEPCRANITITPAKFEDIGLNGCILTMKQEEVSLSRDLTSLEVLDLINKLKNSISSGG